MSRAISKTGLWACVSGSEVAGRENKVKIKRNAFFGSDVFICIYLFHIYIFHIYKNKSFMYFIFLFLFLLSVSLRTSRTTDGCPSIAFLKQLSWVYHLLSSHINFSSCSVISVFRDAWSIQPLFSPLSEILCETCCSWLRGNKLFPGKGL